MISLLLTLFISLFSICPFYYQVEDHNENNIVDISESPLVKNFGYNDTNGYQAIFTEADLSSDYLFLNFIDGLTGQEGSEYFNIGLTYFDTWLIYLNDTNGVIRGVSECKTYTTDQVLITRITLNKSSVVYYQNTNSYMFRYFLTLWNNNNVILEYSYYVAIPMLSEHGLDMGNVTLRSYVTQGNPILSNTFNNNWAYCENTLDGFCPFINYFVRKVHIERDNRDTYNYDLGYQNGERVGYQNGYSTGYSEASNVDSTASTIIEGIFDVGLLPVNVFLTIFNFELFGVNIAGIVSGLLTLSVVVIILRFLLGGKKDD